MSKKVSIYKKKILKELYFHKHLSCTHLSNILHLSLPVVIKMINELIEEGFVLETGLAPSTGGRRPSMYSLKKDVLYIVAVAMDQFVTRIVIMNMQNQYVSDIIKFELPLANNKEATNILAQKIEEVVETSGISKDLIAGVGIGMPGFVDGNNGENYTFLKVKDKTIVEIISEKTGLPVYIDNDSSLIALAELRFGSARKRKNAMVINIGWGIGLGLVLNEKLFRGNDGFAGEFSHIPLFSNNKLCSCGKRGCLETESSLLVVIEKAIEGLKAGRVSVLTVDQLPINHCEKASETIVHAALNGDQFAVELLSEAGYNIGRGVAILIHLLNPELIILSGRGSVAGKIWQAPIQQALNEHCIPRLSSNADIKISELGYEAELIGAAAYVMENYEKELNKKNVPSNSAIDSFITNN